ncbi:MULTISPECIES: DUF6479 family protein [Streptomyces]|uniref:DUF6479 family protein n=1 Tax=Streptomyces cremeus TaxID=66881 RepID=A0ABV5PPY7_STRCM
MNSSQILAAEGGPSLLLIVVGVVVVLFLLGAFFFGSRRAGNKKRSEVPGQGAGSPPQPSGGSQRGETWQTIDDDPDQGNPHR